MKKLEGKTAVITGASKGIGAGIASVFAKYGAKLVLAARGEKVYELAEELRRQGAQVIGVQADVSRKEDMKRLMDTAIKEYGTIDILVSNAGICVLEDFMDAEDDEIRDRHFDINIKGAWNAVKAVLPEMKKNKKGKIVIMSSVTGYMVADPGEAAYATSKAALIGFTRAMAREVAADNITVNAICPGYVRTPLVEGMARQSDPADPERAISAIAQAVPLRRLADPKEIGELAAFLGSEESSYITGTQVVIDGGSTLPETSSMGQ